MKRFVIAFVACMGLLAAGCSGSSDGGSASNVDTGEVLTALATGPAVESYSELSSSLEELNSSATAFCAAADPDSLGTLRDAWKKSISAYEKTKAFSFGPSMDERLMGDLAFVARPDSIDKLLDSTDPLDKESVAELGAPVRGLFAVEYEVFADDSEVLVDDGNSDRRCELVQSQSALMVDSAAKVTSLWKGAYGTDFAAGIDGAEQASVSLLVNELIFTVQELDEQGLRDLLVVESPDELGDNQADGSAAYKMAENKGLMVGSTASIGDEDTGVAALVGSRSTETRDRLIAAEERARTAMEALPDSVDASFDDKEALTAASQAVADLKVLLVTEVTSQLGVTITFSDADGDA